MSTQPDHAPARAPHAFLSGGFRPFFLAGSIWAVVVVAIWVAMLAGSVTLPTLFDPLAWHRHEMLFGYLGAIVAGFLLTAIPNWTGRPPLSGAPLGWLSGLWLAGRFAVTGSALIGWWPAMIVDASFLFVMAGLAAREIAAAKNRNMPLVGAILLLAAGNVLDHLGATARIANPDLGWQLGFAIVLMLIALIGGRIIPTFTRNWLSAQGQSDGLPPAFNQFDRLVLVASAFSLIGWIVGRGTAVSGALLIVAGLLHIARLIRWQGTRTVADPLVAILHLSYAWLPLGLLLLGASSFTAALLASAALHALSAGAMASMTLAVMTRATLGHTGHALRADRPTIAIYVLANSGAAVRLVAPLLPFDTMRTVAIAGVLWAAAFALFVVHYGPKLLRPRPTRASG